MTTTNDDLRQRLEGLTRESDALKAQIEAIKQGSEAFSAPDFLGLAQATLDVMRNDLDRPQPWRGKDITRAVASRLGFDVRLNDVRRDRGELEYEYCLRWVRFALAHRPNNSHPYIQRSVKGDKGDMPEHEWNLQKGRCPWVESELREHLRDYLMSWRADGYSPLVGRANGLGRVDDLIGPADEESATEASRPAVTPSASTSADAEQASPAGWPESWAYDVVGSCQLVLRVVASLTQETLAVDSPTINQRARKILGLVETGQPIQNQVQPDQISGTAVAQQAEHGTRMNVARTLLQQMGLLQQDQRKMWSLTEGATGSSLVNRDGVGEAINTIAREQGKEWYKGNPALNCNYRRSAHLTSWPTVVQTADAPRTVAGNWSDPMTSREVAKTLHTRLGPDGWAFEVFIRDLLQRQDDDREVRLRGGTAGRWGDGNRDVEILVDGVITELVECKLWDREIDTRKDEVTGTSPYRSFQGALAGHATATAGLFVTTGTFSTSVWRESAQSASSKRLRLWDRDSLVDEMRNVSFCIRDADSGSKLLLDLDALDKIKHEAAALKSDSASRTTGRIPRFGGSVSRSASQRTSAQQPATSPVDTDNSISEDVQKWALYAKSALAELRTAGSGGQSYENLRNAVARNLKVSSAELIRGQDKPESPHEYAFRNAVWVLHLAKAIGGDGRPNSQISDADQIWQLRSDRPDPTEDMLIRTAIEREEAAQRTRTQKAKDE